MASPSSAQTTAASLTQKVGVVNSHCDYAATIAKKRFDGVYDHLRSYWLPRFHAGGVRVVVTPVCVDSVYVPDGAMRHTFRVIDGLFQEFEENKQHIELAYSYVDIERINGQGKIAALLAFEGAEALGHDLGSLRVFYRLGLRMLALTWMRRTAFGDGGWENESNGGLTRLGRAAVREMEELGIIVDISHASDRTTADILELAEKPVVASHSNARSVYSHFRNLTDDAIRSVARTGGVVGVTAVPRYIEAGEPTIQGWVDHLEHVVTVAGIEHVGIGADFHQHLFDIGAFQGIDEWSPEAGMARKRFTGMLGPDDLPALTEELLRRGYGESAITAIFRENYLRVMRQVLG